MSPAWLAAPLLLLRRTCRLRGLGFPTLRRSALAGGGGQKTPDATACWATVRTQDTIGADCAEPLGQHVLQEAAQKRFCGSRPVLPPLAPALLDAEGDVPVFARVKAVGGDGNPVDGGGEGGEDLRAGASRCTVGHPALVPDPGRHGSEETGSGQRRRARAPEDLGARVDGSQPLRRAGGAPRRAVRRQGPTRHERMDLRMVGHLPGPGVEDAHHADLPTEVCGVQGEGLQGSRGGLQEQGVYAGLG